MIEMLKRHEVQVLRRTGHTWKEVAALSTSQPAAFREGPGANLKA
jgi:hypothetical protein